LTIESLPANSPMNSRISVACRVRKTANSALLVARLAISMYALKIANASRIQPWSFASCDGLASGATSLT
jgi:hypothetical protein